MILSELLDEYEKVTSACRELLEAEIAALKEGRHEDSESVLDEKKALIDKMGSLLNSLRKFSSHTKESTMLEQDQINFLQQRFMQILKLDRELEKLLLSRNSPQVESDGRPLDRPIHLARLYRKSGGSTAGASS